MNELEVSRGHFSTPQSGSRPGSSKHSPVKHLPPITFTVSHVLDKVMAPPPAFKVCDACRTHLLCAFEHCTGQTDVLYPALHEFDELQASVRLTEAPVLHKVEDPIRPSSVGDPLQLIRGKGLAQKSEEAKREAELTRAIVQGHDIVSQRDSPKSFAPSTSSHIFKSLVQSKAKELQNTREHLAAQTLLTHKESDNVKKLQAALTRAMNYYTRAEEWQERESRALQDGVRALKEEMAAIMSWLIKVDLERKEVHQLIRPVDFKFCLNRRWLSFRSRKVLEKNERACFK